LRGASHFPDDFKIGPSRVVARDGIGNAVPPPVMQRLLSFYKIEERAVEEPVAKRRRA
jgi:site-specific DNA-cytosine methylase